MTTNRRWIALFLAFVLVVLSAPGARAADLSAQSAVLLDAQSGRFLYEKNPVNPMLIASTTKIMTALVVLSRCDPDEIVTVRPEQTGVEGSSMYLRPDEQLTVRDLLYGLLLASGNDAAEALAVHCAGSVSAFAGMMNDKARDLKLTQSHFVNPHGLNANRHYSCARDLALIAREALQNAEFRQIASTKNIVAAGRALKNHNKLLWDYPGAVGVKTGYTIKAGRCLVSAAERDGRLLIAVTLSCPDEWKEHTAMLDAGFDLFTAHTLCTAGDSFGPVPILSGTAGKASVRAKETLTIPLTDEERSRVELALELPWAAWAPVTQGEAAGHARYMLDGRLLCQTELYYAEDIPAYAPKTFWQSLSEFWGRRGQLSVDN